MNSKERAHVPLKSGPLTGVAQYTPEDLNRALEQPGGLAALDQRRMMASLIVQSAALAHAVSGGWHDCGCAECGRIAPWFANAREANDLASEERASQARWN